jgi:hypothetical protein
MLRANPDIFMKPTSRVNTSPNELLQWRADGSMICHTKQFSFVHRMANTNANTTQIRGARKAISRSVTNLQAAEDCAPLAVDSNAANALHASELSS